MKSIILIVSAIVLLTSCNKGSDSGGAPAVDPIIGTWNWVHPSSTTITEKGLIAYINADGTFNSLDYVATNNSGLISAYIRKNIGTYTRSGDNFTVKYSYETCNPMGTDTFTAKVSDTNKNQLSYVSGDKTILATFVRAAESSGESVNVTMVEDKDCDKF